MKKYSLTLLFLFSCLLLFSQGNVQIDKKHLFENKNNRSIAKKNFNKAEEYFNKAKYLYALNSYLKVYRYNSSSPGLNFKIGVCYLYTSDKNTSLKYFTESSSDVSKSYNLFLGRAYQYNNKFEKAKSLYEEYYNSLTKHKQKKNRQFIEQLEKDCDTGSLLLKDSVPVSIINLGPTVNSMYDDYNGIISNDNLTLFFTSRRPAGTQQMNKPRKKLKERIYQADNNATDYPAGYIKSVKGLNGNPNTSLAGFNKDNFIIYYYKGRGKNGRLFAATIDTAWHKKQLKGINHIAFQETSITFDKNGNAYFVTNRYGGYGGKDIWTARLRRDMSFHRPVNMGSIINTPEDEEGVYITPDGKTLYFSSKGHQGMGGFDVFKTVKSEDGTWSKPVNMGYPINSPADELFYHPTKDSCVTLYTTIRPGGYGGYDIYKILIGNAVSFILSGKIYDTATSAPVPAKINIYEAKSYKLIKSLQNDPNTGNYILKIETDGDYLISIESKGYTSITKAFKCKRGEDKTDIANFPLTKQVIEGLH